LQLSLLLVAKRSAQGRRLDNPLRQSDNDRALQSVQATSAPPQALRSAPQGRVIGDLKG
jgi:hypothetical protein